MAKYVKQIELGTDSSGKRIRKRIYANTKTELRRLEDEAKSEAETTLCYISFRDYSQKWLKGKHVEAATREAYEICLKKCEPIEHMRLSDIKKSDVQDLINEYWEKPATARKLRVVLVQIFNRAIDDDLIIKNPAERLDMPKMNLPERNYLTDEQKDALSRCCLNETERLFVDMLYYFGLRPGEALALSPSDFNFKTNELTINKAVGYEKNGRGYLKKTKTGSIRVLPIPASVVEEVQRLSGKKMYLFETKNGSLMSKSTEKRLWKSIKKKWNAALGGDEESDMLEGVRPYYFRYNFATDLYYSGISLKKAAYLMGHADTAMLLRVYAQLDDNREDVEQLLSRKY